LRVVNSKPLVSAESLQARPIQFFSAPGLAEILFRREGAATRTLLRLFVGVHVALGHVAALNARLCFNARRSAAAGSFHLIGGAAFLLLDCSAWLNGFSSRRSGRCARRLRQRDPAEKQGSGAKTK
jgi:hypothetical protein